jgi:p-hydroxybenzoate 3-monooxygenase
MCSAASAPACSRRSRWRCSTRPAPARAHARDGLVHDGVELPSTACAIASISRPLTGKTVMIYGQTEDHARPHGRPRAAGAPTVYEAHDVKPA